jgi:SAM-dependent methyltransferase
MGFDVQAVRFLLSSHRSGVRFTRTALIGRQELFLDATSLQRILSSFGWVMTQDEVERILTEENGFAEPLLRLLGAEHITSLDASPYEGSSVVHDMNVEIPDSLKSSFSAVIDAGTLEHVFDFPRAIKNCLEMVQPDGHLLLITPANNFMGHGFYQFSPELFFRVCSEANGFELVRSIFCEVDAARWYEVVDPAKARRRVELVNSRPAYLMILARRVREVPVLATAPQQSDYTVLWQEGGTDRRKRLQSERLPLPARLLRRIVRRLGAAYRKLEPSAFAARRLAPDREVFREVSWRS